MKLKYLSNYYFDNIALVKIGKDVYGYNFEKGKLYKTSKIVDYYDNHTDYYVEKRLADQSLITSNLVKIVLQNVNKERNKTIEYYKNALKEKQDFVARIKEVGYEKALEEEKAKDPMKYAYQEMFYGCVGIKDVPALPVNKPNVKENIKGE